MNPPIPSDARPALRQLKTHEIPKWAYETPQYWDSTDVHPLRDLSMILGGACDNLEKKAKDGVTLNMVKLHDAVCALKDAFPTPYKDQLKVLDVGFYTLAQAPYINQPDIRNYLWDKQMEIINRDFPTFPYRLLMAKQFKPNGKYADFRVGLKLPRATSGMFEKMNDAVEEAMQTIILKTIEDEYKRTNDLMAAETKGVEKLKELLGKIEDVSTMSLEFLKLNGFEEVPFNTVATLSRSNNQLLDDLVKDYSGLEITISGQKVSDAIFFCGLIHFHS